MKLPVVIDPRYHDAVLFDLDGVVADTAAIHAKAWASVVNDFLAGRPTDERENHAPFTDDDYRGYLDDEPRYEGLTDFLSSRGISLDQGSADDAATQATVCGLGNREHQLFRRLLADGVPPFESTVALLRQLHAIGVATAVYSAGRDCERVLEAAGIEDVFSVRVDGVIANGLGLPGKPDPAVLVETAHRLQVRPDRCVVIDDSEAGVTAGRNGGFGFVL